MGEYVLILNNVETKLNKIIRCQSPRNWGKEAVRHRIPAFRPR